MVDLYQRQYDGPTVTPAPMAVGANPASMFGGGLSALADAMRESAADTRRTDDRIAEIRREETRIENSRQIAAATALAMGSWGETQQQMHQAVLDAQQNQQPGAVGYTAAVTEAVNSRAKAFMASLPPEVAQHFAGTVANVTTGMITGAQSYEAGEFAKLQGQGVDSYVSATRNRLLGEPTQDNLRDALAGLRDQMAGLHLPESAAAKMFEKGRNSFVTGMLDGLVSQGKAADVRALVGSGQLDAVLVGGQKAGYLDQADNLDTIAQRQAAAQAAEAQRTARDALKSIKVDIDNGTPVAASTIQGAIAAAKAAGLPEADLKEAAYLGRDSLNATQIAGLSTPALTQTMAPLQAARAAGTIKPEERAWLERGEKELDKRGEAAGLKLAPLLKGGPADRAQGIAQLAAMPIDERMRAARHAGDDKAGIIAAMAPNGRALAIEGGELRRARPEDFLPPVGVAGGKDRAARERAAERIVRDALGPLAEDLGGAYPDVRDAMYDLMAGGAHGWNEGRLRAAAQSLYGRGWRADGVSQGGIGSINGHPFELPHDWSEAEFARAYARNTFAGAIYADGSAAAPDDVRRNYRLRAMGGAAPGITRYMPVNAQGQPLMRKTGRGLEPYTFDVAQKPPVWLEGK